MKLRTLDCASSSEGCTDLQPDARPADSQVLYQDAGKSGSGDLGSADSGIRPGAIDVFGDDRNLPDTGGVIVADDALSDTASLLPESLQDAAPSDARASDGGRAPDAYLLPSSIDTKSADTISADTMSADTMSADTRFADAVFVDMMPADIMLEDTTPADTAGSPEALPVDSGPSADTAAADAVPDAVTNYTVSFSAGKASGAMSGNGWVTMGVKDTVTSPTCGASATPLTPSANCPASSINWDAPSALCVSGVIPALPSSPTSVDYTENWGIKVGANANEAQGPVGLAFRTIAFNLTGSPSTGLRAVVHMTGAASDTTYCAFVTSAEPVPLTSFSTSCWDGTGTFLTAEDAPNIDHIGIQVSSGGQEVTVTQLCLTGIVLGS